MMSLPLFLNDVSGSEIVIILLFILIFFGSKSIPSIAKTLGKSLYQIRNASSEIQNEIKKSGVDIGKDINLKNIMTEKQEELIEPMDQIYSEVENTIHYDNSTIKKPVENSTPVENTTPEIDSNSSDQKNQVT
jgi:sec-independent protein translocase protein TatA